MGNFFIETRNLKDKCSLKGKGGRYKSNKQKKCVWVKEIGSKSEYDKVWDWIF